MKGRGLMMELMPLHEEIWKNLLPFPTSEKLAICKAKSRPQELNGAGILISDFQPPELLEINAYCLNNSVHDICNKPKLIQLHNNSGNQLNKFLCLDYIKPNVIRLLNDYQILLKFYLVNT